MRQTANNDGAAKVAGIFKAESSVCLCNKREGIELQHRTIAPYPLSAD